MTYLLEKLKEVEIPEKVIHFANNYERRYYRYYTLMKFLSKIVRLEQDNTKRTNVLKKEWDYLIILDACRYDAFSHILKEYTLNFRRTKLAYIYSVGSDTVEFLTKTFSNVHRRDIIYVTANPYVDIYVHGKVFKIISVWKEYWNSEFNTVHPKDVYEIALKYAYLYPDKKMIIHFIQPHYPFLCCKQFGDTGILYHRLAALGIKGKSDITIWDLFFDGMITLKDIIKGYMYNLKLALDYVLRLINKLSGRIIITADHGEGFGEQIKIGVINIGIYGHIPGIPHISLIKVPWLVIEKPIEAKRGIKGINYIKAILRSKIISHAK